MRDLTSCISVCKEIPNSRSRIIRDFAGKAQGYLGICADVVFSLSSVTTSFTPAITPELSDDSQPGGGASYAMAPAA